MRARTRRTRSTCAVCLFGALAGCPYRNDTREPDSGLGDLLADALPTACGSTTLSDDDYGGCPSGGANPTACTAGRSVDACGAWVQAPAFRLERAVGLHEYSVSSPSSVDFGCLATPPAAGPVHVTTLSGFVRILSNNPPEGTVGVQVQAFGVDTSSGAILGQVGETFVTSSSDATTTNDWLYTCTPSPCVFRRYHIANVPTETPLVLLTSDGTGTGSWANLYDYGVYFSDAVLCAASGGAAPARAPCVSATGPTWATSYDVTAVLASDVQSLAADAEDVTLDPSQGMLLGEVHDCGDIRVSGANADTDAAHDGPVFYFSADEAEPLPDTTRSEASEGTSVLGRFGALNLAAGTPIRVSAIGVYRGHDTLLGTEVVQTYAGPSVTSVILRGRLPYQ